MNLDLYFNNQDEKPLDNLVANGGMTSILRKVCCIGDSLSSGEMESFMKDNPENEGRGWHDYYDYSWGQFMARDAGLEVLNFSCGGMNAKTYCEAFADERNFWSPEKACRAYIIALGVNDANFFPDDENGITNFGDITDVDLSDWRNNKKTFVGYYCQIIQRLREIQPKAPFFLMTVPKVCYGRPKSYDRHAEIIYKIAELFEYTYVLDMRKYSPPHDEDFRKMFYMGDHLNAAGYRFAATMVASYIDYIIRHNPDDFRQIAFVGTEYRNENYNW